MYIWFPIKRRIIFLYTLILVFFLTIIIYILFIFLLYRVENKAETIRVYECGFDPNSVTRIRFSYRFYLISILFIIFDVEISLILPVPFLNEIEIGMIIFIIFIIVLIIGLLYEYYCGSLNWIRDIIKS